MPYSLDFLPIIQLIGVFTSIAVLVYIVNLKRDFSWIWMIFVVLPIYLLLGELPKGNGYDLFFNLPWTLPFALVIAMLTFLVLGFKFAVQNQTVILFAVTFFVLLGFHEALWAHLIGVAFYLLFVLSFITLGIKTIQHWLSDNP